LVYFEGILKNRLQYRFISAVEILPYA